MFDTSVQLNVQMGIYVLFLQECILEYLSNIFSLLFIVQGRSKSQLDDMSPFN